MLVVKLELWPHGEERAAEEVGRVELWNTGWGDLLVGVYGFKVTGDWEHYNQEASTKVFETGIIEGFPRDKAGAWALLREALAQALPPVELVKDKHDELRSA